MPADATHEFGSQDTEIKLSVVESYLRSYTTALKSKWPNLWYIDAFAGTGQRTVRVAARNGDLFDEPVPEVIEQRRGSAQIAIDIDPPFDRLIFMDANERHCAALDELKKSYSDRDISVIQGDANKLIQARIDWSGWKSTRAVMFLDPYGMDVEWETLVAISRTKAIDVWYLFSLSGLYRQAARNLEAVDASKRAALTRMLGTNEWEQEIYSPVENQNLLSLIEPFEARQRQADVQGLEGYVKRRLETIFPLVMDPLPLPVQRKPQRFSLFCAISNPDPKALGLAKKFGNHILNAGRSSQVRPR